MRKNNNTNSDVPDDLAELRAAWEALQQSQQSKTPVVKKPISPKPQATSQSSAPSPQLPTRKRGLLGRLLRKAYLNYMYGPKHSRDYAGMLANGDLELEDSIEFASKIAYLNSPEYRQQQMLDQMASNNEALAERIISQGMTWLYPRFEDKLEDILKELKKK